MKFNKKKAIDKGLQVGAGIGGAIGADLLEKKAAEVIKDRKARLGVMLATGLAGAIFLDGIAADVAVGFGIEAGKKLTGEFVPQLGITGTGDEVLNGFYDEVLNGINEEDAEINGDDDMNGDDDLSGVFDVENEMNGDDDINGDEDMNGDDDDNM